MVTVLCCTEQPGHWGGPVFVFDVSMQGFGAVISGRGLVTVGLAAEQVLWADGAINLTPARLCRIQG